MTLYEMIKARGTGKGEETMWRSVAIISDSIEKHYTPEAKSELMSEIYGLMSGGHFDEHYAPACVAKMYYTDEDGEKHYAPYWSEPQIRAIYNQVAKSIPDTYTFWDFYVTFNMVASDNWVLIHKWFPSITEAEFAEKITDLAVAWLDDPDNPYRESKVWKYLHAK